MAETTNPGETAQQGKGRKVLLMLVAIFVLPFTMAVILHFFDVRPGGQSFGNLITPPVKLTIPELEDVEDNAYPADSWQEIWTIVTVNRGACGEACQASVDKLRRIHTSLAKEHDRVQRALLIPNQYDVDAVRAMQEKFPDLMIYAGDAAALLAFSNQFDAAAPQADIYLVDPLNNVMMHYSHDIPSKELRSDLVRLLKNSWAG